MWPRPCPSCLRRSLPHSCQHTLLVFGFPAVRCSPACRSWCLSHLVFPVLPVSVVWYLPLRVTVFQLSVLPTFLLLPSPSPSGTPVTRVLRLPRSPHRTHVLQLLSVSSLCVSGLEARVAMSSRSRAVSLRRAHPGQPSFLLHCYFLSFPVFFFDSFVGFAPLSSCSPCTLPTLPPELFD